MLLILEIFFLVAGISAIISGKLPSRLLKTLFGRGEYSLPPTQSRLFGLLLASPIPLALMVSFTLAVLFGERGASIGIGFEYVYLFGVIIAAIAIARRARRVEESPAISPESPNPALPTTERSYGMKLLMFFGIGFLLCITTISFSSLVTVIYMELTVGSRVTGDFWQDVFPNIFLIAIIVAGSFGIYKLARAMRNQ